MIDTFVNNLEESVNCEKIMISYTSGEVNTRINTTQ